MEGENKSAHPTSSTSLPCTDPVTSHSPLADAGMPVSAGACESQLVSTCNCEGLAGHVGQGRAIDVRDQHRTQRSPLHHNLTLLRDHHHPHAPRPSSARGAERERGEVWKAGRGDGGEGER
eukprot:913148-Rhodomonas_salina.1